MITDAPNKAAWQFPMKQKAEKKLAQEVLTGLLTEASAWLSNFVKEKDLVVRKVQGKVGKVRGLWKLN